MAQVQKEEGNPVEQPPDGLIYDATIVGSDAHVFFNFTQGRLTSGSYVIDNDHDAADVDAYFKLQEALVQKYGEPDSKDADWRDPYRAPELKTYAEAAKAIATGELKLRTLWFTDDTRIMLLCVEQKDRYNALVWLFYDELRGLKALAGERKQADIALL